VKTDVQRKIIPLDKWLKIMTFSLLSSSEQANEWIG
jgi:hypothetical protein